MLTARIKQDRRHLGVAIIFAAWAMILLIAFLANRGSDIGQLPNLAGNFGGGPVVGAGIIDSLVGVVIACLIAAAWFGIGSFILSAIKPEMAENRSVALDLAIKIAIGAAFWSLIWFFLGVAGAYNRVGAAVSLVVGISLAIFGLRRKGRSKREVSPEEKVAVFERIVQILIGVPVLLAFVASLAPPTAKDTLLYHFSVPKAFIEQGGNGIIEGNIASYLALGTEMHTVWAMLLGGFVSQRAGETAAGVTIFLFFPLLLIAVYGWSRESGISRGLSLIAALMVAAVPTAFYVASSGYIDIALALFVTLAIYSLTRWWKSLENRWLVMITVFLGAALSIKLTSLFVFAAFALIILFRARNAKEDSGNAGKILMGGFGAFILASVIALPWYVRTWSATGSPVFPFYMSILKGAAPGWDVERSNLFQGMISQYGGENKNALDYLIAPWNLSVAAQPEVARFFDGVLGIAFLFGLPILVWGLWKFDLPIEAKIGSVVAGIVFLFWLFSSQQLRYLLPVIPVLAVAIAASAEAIVNGGNALHRVWQYGFVAACIAGVLVSTSWFLQKAPLRVALGGETREVYLARNLDYYPFYQTINLETAPDAKIWLINTRRDTYTIDRPVISDYIFEDWTLKKMVWESRSTQELKAKTAALGIKYVLTRHDFLFDFDKSTLVDDSRPRAENDAKLKIAREFILDKANTVRADEKFSLIKVF